MTQVKFSVECAQSLTDATRCRAQWHQAMLSSVSHDLKTPLASIIGSLEIYERTKATLPVDRQEVLIGTALQEAYRLDMFITNILDMNRLDAGQVGIQPDLCDIGEILKNTLAGFAHRLRDSDRRVYALAGKMNVRTDATLLSRALGTLVDNAITYGGKPLLLRVEFGKEGDLVFIRVQDNGKGIPESRLEAVFSRYTRLQSGDCRKAGTGLGLTICREIMRLLGGSVVAGRADCGGAALTLRLPLQR